MNGEADKASIGGLGSDAFCARDIRCAPRTVRQPPLLRGKTSIAAAFIRSTA